MGAAIHGYVPTDFIVRYAGRDNPLAVPVAVLIAIPLYSNAAGTIPIVQALIDKGVPLGATLAFAMAITAISVPELVILRRVIKPRLIAIFVAIVTLAVVSIGYSFNAIFCATSVKGASTDEREDSGYRLSELSTTREAGQ